MSQQIACRRVPPRLASPRRSAKDLLLKFCHPPFSTRRAEYPFYTDSDFYTTVREVRWFIFKILKNLTTNIWFLVGLPLYSIFRLKNFDVFGNTNVPYFNHQTCTRSELIEMYTRQVLNGIKSRKYARDAVMDSHGDWYANGKFVCVVLNSGFFFYLFTRLGVRDVTSSAAGSIVAAADEVTVSQHSRSLLLLAHGRASTKSERKRRFNYSAARLRALSKFTRRLIISLRVRFLLNKCY